MTHTYTRIQLAGPLWTVADVKALQLRITDAAQDADVQEKLDTYGAEDGGGTREKFRQFISTEMVKWAKVVKDGKVKIDS